MYNAPSGGVNLGRGTEWWYNAAPYVTMNMFGNAQAKRHQLLARSHLNIYDTATLNVSGGIIVQTVAAVDDWHKFMNLAGGQLSCLRVKLLTQYWIQRGILLAYGRSQNIADFVHGYMVVVPCRRVTVETRSAMFWICRRPGEMPRLNQVTALAA